MKAIVDGAVTNLETAFQELDVVMGQARRQCVVRSAQGKRPVLVIHDRWGEFNSVYVENSLDDADAGECDFELDVEGVGSWYVPTLRYLCGFRVTWGQRPNVASNQTMFALAPQDPSVTWPSETLKPLEYGELFKQGFLDTGGRPMLGMHHVNWVLDPVVRRRYADQACCFPFHVREPVWPYRYLLQGGYSMGPNKYSPKGMRNVIGGVSGLGMKPFVSHLSSPFMWSFLESMERYDRDQVEALGKSSCMHGYGLTDSQVREQGRGLSLACDGYNVTGDVGLGTFLEAALREYDSLADNVSGVAAGRGLDSKKGWYCPYWQFAYLEYALDYMLESGIAADSDYLEACLDLQTKLSPISPYWLYLKGDVPIESHDMSELLAKNSGVRESEAWVRNFVRARHGRDILWDYASLMDDPGTSKPSHNVAFKVLEPVKRGSVMPQLEAGQEVSFLTWKGDGYDPSNPFIAGGPEQLSPYLYAVRLKKPLAPPKPTVKELYERAAQAIRGASDSSRTATEAQAAATDAFEQFGRAYEDSLPKGGAT